MRYSRPAAAAAVMNKLVVQLYEQLRYETFIVKEKHHKNQQLLREHPEPQTDKGTTQS